MRYLSFFNSVSLKVELDTANGVAILRDRRTGCDGLSECKFFHVRMNPDQKPTNDLMLYALNGAAMLMHDVNGPYFRNGTIVIKVPDVPAGNELYLCPVCGSKGEFQSFPTVPHLMNHKGSVRRCRGAKARNWDDILVQCPDCSYHDKKKIFNTGTWKDMAGKIRALPTLPI